ncbi:MAG: cation transporter [Coriobacteriia bacterium]|nr:cation transporter [Coriobacteriia bacterium]
MTETKSVRLQTTGMHCQSCAMLVDMTVGDLAGVEEVKTDYATGETTVSFDADQVTVDDIVTAVKAAGYDASET